MLKQQFDGWQQFILKMALQNIGEKLHQSKKNIFFLLLLTNDIEFTNFYIAVQ